jgi:hypothetical protein
MPGKYSDHSHACRAAGIAFDQPIRLPDIDKALTARFATQSGGRQQRLGSIVTMTCYLLGIAAATLCLTQAACNRRAESAASVPSAESFKVGLFEVRLGEVVEKVNGALVTSAFFREAKFLPLVGRVFVEEEYQRADTGVVVVAFFCTSYDLI